MSCEPAIDAKEAAKILKVSTNTVYRYVRQRVIPHFYIGARLRFRESSLDEWIRKRIEEGQK